MTDTTDRSSPSPGLAIDRSATGQFYPWYDSNWLSKYTKAKSILRDIKPDALPTFIDAFRVFHTRPDFRVNLLEQPFDSHALEEIRRVVKSLQPTDLELYEAAAFGRFIVHNLSFFNELQQQALPLVSEVVGEPVEASYNFLSLYSAKGVCSVHLDAPHAKWTLDLCIDQNTPWPIYFSQVTPWPDSEEWNCDQSERNGQANWQDEIRHSPSLRFTPCTLQPGQAAVFSGSSQWHYRDPMPQAGSRSFCTLLFLHFIPSGTGELVWPHNWARLFGVPELNQVAGNRTSQKHAERSMVAS